MNDNRNHTPAGQPVTQPLYNGQPVYTAPQNPAPVQNPTPVYTYPPQGGNGAPVYAQPVQQPVYYAPVQPPKWADKNAFTALNSVSVKTARPLAGGLQTGLKGNICSLLLRGSAAP